LNGIRHRWFSQNLESALKVLPVTVVTGARQTGKTTLAKSLDAKRAYFTLDDVGVLDQAERNPDSLLTTRPVTLDEVQRTPQLLLAVKRAVDERRRGFRADRIRQFAPHGQGGGHTGRSGDLSATAPFCPAEWMQRKEALEPIDRLFLPDFDLHDWPDEKGNWQRWLLCGGFPPALAIEADRDRGLWFAAYVQTYLERDLRQLSDVASLPDFQRLMALAANRTGKLLNQADLSRDAALSHPTAHRYLNLLETGCLITRIRPFTTNPSSAMVKAPKLLWSDCGLAAWLAGIRAPEDVAKRLDSGFWLEQTLYQTLQAWRAMDPVNRRLHFWRDRAGHEVDFILEQNGKLVAIEIKSSSQVSMSDAAGIQALKGALKKSHNLVCGVVLHAGKARPLDKDILALPWGWMVKD
jgi:hypothetical protein